jgi:hypothetical protein
LGYKQIQHLDSASARISKRLLEEKGREQFWPKKGNLHRIKKNGWSWYMYHKLVIKNK